MKKIRIFVMAILFMSVTSCNGSNEPSFVPPQVENADENDNSQKEEYGMNILVNGHTLKAKMAANSATQALMDLLKQGSLTLKLQEYGGFEKVGSLGHTLPASNSQITTSSGDIVLYQGNQLVLFYGSNSWSYTRLGKIEGVSQSELKNILGTGDVTVVLSLSE